MSKEVVYLWQPVELSGTTRYKIEGSTKSDLTKYKRTNKGANYKLAIECDNATVLCKSMVQAFELFFKRLPNTEYFEGEVEEMVKLMQKVALQQKTGSAEPKKKATKKPKPAGAEVKPKAKAKPKAKPKKADNAEENENSTDDETESLASSQKNAPPIREIITTEIISSEVTTNSQVLDDIFKTKIKTDEDYAKELLEDPDVQKMFSTDDSLPVRQQLVYLLQKYNNLLRDQL